MCLRKSLIQFIENSIDQFYSDMELDGSIITIEQAIQVKEISFIKDRYSKVGEIKIKLVGSIYGDEELEDLE